MILHPPTELCSRPRELSLTLACCVGAEVVDSGKNSPFKFGLGYSCGKWLLLAYCAVFLLLRHVLKILLLGNVIL
jgi:hypothetical protein